MRIAVGPLEVQAAALHLRLRLHVRTPPGGPAAAPLGERRLRGVGQGAQGFPRLAVRALLSPPPRSLCTGSRSAWPEKALSRFSAHSPSAARTQQKLFSEAICAKSCGHVDVDILRGWYLSVHFGLEPPDHDNVGDAATRIPAPTGPVSARSGLCALNMVPAR